MTDPTPNDATPDEESPPPGEPPSEESPPPGEPPSEEGPFPAMRAPASDRASEPDPARHDAAPHQESPAPGERAPGPAPARLAPYRFGIRALAFALGALGAVFGADLLVMRSRHLRRVVLLEHAYDLERLERSHGSLLYLGDSVVGWGGDKEGAERVLPALAADAGGAPVTDASHPAYGPRCFEAQVAALARRGDRPQGLLLELSLAAFGPRRAENPSWHFGLRRSLLHSGSYLPRRALAVFEEGFGARTQRDYEAQEVQLGGKPLAKIGPLRGLPPAEAGEAELQERYRLRLLCDYATPIQTSSEWAATRSLFARLAQLELPVVVYLTPYDQEAIRRLLTYKEQALIRANVAALIAAAEQEGLTLHDLSELLPSREFDTPPGVTAEHLYPTGREVVMGRLRPHLRRALAPK